MKHIRTFKECKDIVNFYNFNIGDHIFCIDTGEDRGLIGLEYGKEYIIVDINTDNFLKTFKIKDAETGKIIAGSPTGYWLEIRFCPFEEYITTKFNV